MSDRLPIVVSALAAEQIRAAANWWQVNRSKAPSAFREDLERATSLLAIQPQSPQTAQKRGSRHATAPRMAISQAQRCRRKFLHYFPGGFEDPKYIDWERQYKDDAHRSWNEQLSQSSFDALLEERKWSEIVSRAIRIEARTNLLFSFEKMAIRDAVKTTHGAHMLAEGLYHFLHGRGPDNVRFAEWCDTIGRLPRRGTRVLTWPVVTVFGFLAQPKRHIFLKPNVTRAAAVRYGFDLEYRSRPDWAVYKSLLDFAALLRRDLRDLGPRDMIDLQSFMWVQGSEEYAGRTFKPALTTRIAAAS